MSVYGRMRSKYFPETCIRGSALTPYVYSLPPRPSFASAPFLTVEPLLGNMADVPDIETVETSDDYRHVRFRDPDEFETIRTPDWAANAAQSVSEGAEVRTGKEEGGDDWKVESVLIDKHVGEDTAREEATEIVEKIES